MNRDRKVENDLIPGNPAYPVPGLRYIDDYIDGVGEQELIATIDRQPWILDLRRRVQHYGYKYDYRSKVIDHSMLLGPLPEWLERLAVRLYRENWVEEIPDQVIVNEYTPGQGITPHIDCKPCFAETIASLSVGAACLMAFANKTLGQSYSVILERRSLLVMSGIARYEWTHSIPARKRDVLDGRTVPRERRLSLTFRKVIAKSDS